jgi:quercetin dioxygenase-like cupin family protein
VAQPSFRVTRWPGVVAATENEIQGYLQVEGLRAYRWANAPHDKYSAHSHSYEKVIYVVSGSITFGLPDTGEQIHLSAGDRLDLPAGVMHNATVGPHGVICLEAHR